MGGLVWDKVVNQHQGWRLITSIWLHAGLIHLLVNMLSLLFVGIRLEQQFGFGKLITSVTVSFFVSVNLMQFKPRNIAYLHMIWIFLFLQLTCIIIRFI